MWGLVKAIVRYLVGMITTSADSWNAFWYTPVDPTLLGLIRIALGLMLIYNHAIWGLVLNDFFGADAWINRQLVDVMLTNDGLFPSHYAYSVWWLIPPRWIWPAYTVMMAILCLFTIGLWTRVMSILALAVVISFVNRVPEALFGLDKINVVLTIYLAVGPSGAALSVDRWLARRRRPDAPVHPAPCIGANFALRLIQVHMCIIYAFAGLSKLQGAAWWNGHAMWLAFGNLEYQSADMTWLAWHPRLVEFLTHLTSLWEISFGVLIWVRFWRPLILTASLFMHLGIGYCLGLWTFSIIMLVGCSSFLPPEGVGQLVARLGSLLRPTKRHPMAT
jgi:hypothetical protein